MRLTSFRLQGIRATAMATLAVGMTTGCSGRTPARIQLQADTLTINTVLLEGSMAHALDADGREIPRATIRAAVSSDSTVAKVRGSGIQCRTNGYSSILLESGPATARLIVHCDIIARFGPVGQTELVAGGPPALFGVNAYDADGRLMPQPRVALINSDDRILRLRHGMVSGIRPGVASITASSGRITGGMVYIVRAPAAHRADSGGR